MKMKKSKIFIILLCLVIVAVVGVHLLLTAQGLVGITMNWALRLDGLIIALFIVGGLIVMPSLAVDPEKFVLRFLVLTTLQLLGAFSIVAFLAYTKPVNVKALAFNVLCVYSVLLFAQSVLMIRLNKA